MGHDLSLRQSFPLPVNILPYKMKKCRDVHKILEPQFPAIDTQISSCFDHLMPDMGDIDMEFLTEAYNHNCPDVSLW